MDFWIGFWLGVVLTLGLGAVCFLGFYHWIRT